MKKIKVRIVKKPCKDDMVSLYLDYYPPFPNPDTHRLQRRESLNIRIHNDKKTERVFYNDARGIRQSKIIPVYYPNKYDANGKPIQKRRTLTPIQKNYNLIEMNVAEGTRMQRQIAVNNEDFSFASKKQYNSDFLKFFKDLADDKRASNSSVWNSAYQQFVSFAGDDVKTGRLTYELVEGFMSFLIHNDKIKQNTRFSYFNKFKLAIKEAEEKKIVTTGFYDSIKGLVLKEEEVNIEYLTLEELSIVKDVPCVNELYKKAALFSATTGLRRSDIVKFSWGQIKESNDGLYIDMRQQKTAGVESIGLNEKALSILGERQVDGFRPFGALTNTAWARQDKDLKKWIADAGIKKRITFHCFRHSFSCALLHKGVDIFRVSKLLGHKSVLTTQRTYAKVLTSDKKKAIDTIEF